MNKNLYQVSFGVDYDQKAMSMFFDALPNVSNWFYSMPNSIFVETTLLPNELHAAISKQFGEKGLLFIVQIADNYYGKLPKEHWAFFENVNIINK